MDVGLFCLVCVDEKLLIFESSPSREPSPLFQATRTNPILYPPRETVSTQTQSIHPRQIFRGVISL